MKNIIGKSWRDAASLIVLKKRNSELLSRVGDRGSVNYDILLQTRPHSASFANSVVFPGGTNETIDGSERWLQLFKSFGYTSQDFGALHQSGSAVSPIFKDNPIKRHIELRITAIRETFEELGVLLCSKTPKDNKSDIWVNVVSDFDIKYWQKRVSKNPEDLLSLCEEHKCYPDIWSLHYWSNWLTPQWRYKRFDTVFFITALQDKSVAIESSSEVVNVEWLSPQEILSADKVLYPPQNYEFHRLSHVKDIEELTRLARDRSGYGTDLLYPISLKSKNGTIYLLPGDDLYPSSIDYNDNTVTYIDKTLLELREGCKTLHRFEFNKESKQTELVLHNYKPDHHINMGDKVLPFQKIN